ncbi:hypothetical protein [Spongiimicrobium salis]|uniref:hypothetical protein n=1 Tax=Spongiimicrobium salis TaxID=1667022 RepID=UPI00374D57C5
MAPLKFEENIGEKLGAREIKPSEKAWDTIASKLDVSKPQKKNRFPWYAIAACVIGLLIVSTLYLGRETGVDPMQNTNKVTEAPKNDIDKPSGIQTPAEATVAVQESEVIPEEVTKKMPEGKQIHKDQPQHSPKEVQEMGVTAVASAETIKESTVLNEMDKTFQKVEGIINTKVEGIIAQVNLLEENNEAITDAEVDSLLRIAQKEILTKKLFNEDRTVDAMALLSEVEGELDKSFREQIFEGLKNRFFEVRTALADRNN